MTKEDLYKSFLEDPLLIEKEYVDPAKISLMKFSELSNVKLLEVIKFAVNGTVDGETDNKTLRVISQYLSK